MKSISPAIVLDQANDVYEVEGNSNFIFSLFYNYFFGSNKMFVLKGGLSFSTKNAKLNALPRYLVRDPVTLDTAFLITESEINTYYNMLGLDLTLYGRLSIMEKTYIFLGAGPNFGFILNNKNSDYTTSILGIEDKINSSYKETDITFSNGSKSISFDNDKEPILGELVEGNSFHYGIHLSIGVDWYIKDDLAVRLESIAQGEFSDYFKNYSSGIISTVNIVLGVQYSGLFE